MTVKTAIDPQTVAAVRTFAERIRRDYPARQILLYGSRARGDHRPDSDVDVAVVLPRFDRRKIDLVLEMGDLASDMLINEGLFVTPFPVWQDEWDDPELAFNPWLIGNIKQEGVAF